MSLNAINNIGDFIVKVFIILLAICILFLLKHYLPKYFETKASNQATKEDIGEITTIIENIKNDLLAKSEELKAELNRKNQHIISLNETERQAFLNYNNALWSSVSYYNRISLNDYDESNIEKIKEVIIKYEDLLLIKNIADAELTLFFENEDFIKLNGEIQMILICLAHNLSSTIIKKESLTRKLIIMLKGSNEPAEVYHEMHKGLKKIMDEFYDERKKLNEEIHILWQSLKPVVLKRLSDIANS